MTTRKTNTYATFFTIALLTFTHTVTAATLGSELVTNGDAERGDTSGWGSAGIDVVPSSGAFTEGLPSGVSIGLFSFTGGRGTASGQSLTQLIGVSDLAAQIDQGSVGSLFSVLLQSRRLTLSEPVDSAQATLTFLDMNNEVLSSQTFLDTDFSGPSDLAYADWELFASNGAVPVGTRSISIGLLATRSAGFSSDGFFDNVSLSLVPIPEPSTYALLLLGSAALAVRFRGRR